ncbi:hypothetical protein BX666DRAFT_1359046 [Dichotomocladium elegans]|nr:hypothetical protein BX666DRAFT_1359046 [Dichotomocladium elegans]
MFAQYPTPDPETTRKQISAETKALDDLQPYKEYVQAVRDLYHEAVRDNEPADKILALQQQLKSACDDFDRFRTRYLYPSGTPTRSSYMYERCLNDKPSSSRYIPPRRMFAQLESYARARQMDINTTWEMLLDVLLTENQKAFLKKKQLEYGHVCTYDDVKSWFIDRYSLTERHMTQWITFFNFRMRENQSIKAYGEFYKRELARRDMEGMPGEIILAATFVGNMNDHYKQRAIQLVDRHARSRDLDCDDVTFLVGFANEQWDFFDERKLAQDDSKLSNKDSSRQRG